MSTPTIRHVPLFVASIVCLLCASCAHSVHEGVLGVGAGPVRDGAGGSVAEAGPLTAEPPRLPAGDAPVAEVKGPIRLPERLTLREAFLFALEANKDIRVASLDADAGEARIMGAEGQFDPTVFVQVSRGRANEPVAGVPVGRTAAAEGAITAGVRTRIVTGTDFELSASTDYSRDVTHTSALNPEYEPGVSVGVRQDLLKNFGIGVNRTDIVIAQNNWQIAEEDLRDALIQNLFRVEQAYWQLYFAAADLDVRQTQLERANTLVARAQAQVDVGVSAPIEVTRARSSAAAQAVAILEAKSRITRLRHGLLQLMGVLEVHLVETDFELADAPAERMHRTSLAEAMGAALRSRPDYRQAELAVENSGLQQRFAKNQKLPTLQLFGEFSMTGMDDDFGSSVDALKDGRYDSWEAGLLLEWPIPNRTARSEHRVAQLGRRRAKVRRQAVLETITRDVSDALDGLWTAEGRIETARDARELAQRLLRAEEKSFALGRSDSLDVLNAQAALAAAERDEVRARSDYAIALANLLRVQGDFLDEKERPFVGRATR